MRRNPTIRGWLLCLGGVALTGTDVAGDAERCTTEFRVPIVLRSIATPAVPAQPTAAYLIGNVTPGLRIVDATSGRLLWRGGVDGAVTQRFAAMSAGFTSSLAVIDTDGDGAHDRIYAGDLMGRLWRFDIDTRAPASRWVTGGIFADLGGAPGNTSRGFLAAPDVTLVAPPGMSPWLSIALGTFSTAAGAMNRFYVLRDRAPFEHWTQLQYDRWRPLVEADLRLAEGASVDATPGSAGFYINLGAQQVAASALTLDGTTIYTTSATRSSLLPACNVSTPPASATVSVRSIAAVDGALDATGIGVQAIPSAPADAAVTLVRDENNGSAAFVCDVAGHALPDCFLDSTLRRSFWRREDAD
jgi:hypothetical protein